MISVSDRNWELNKINKNSVEKLKQDYKFSDIISNLIVARNFDETELNSINNELPFKNVFLKNKDFDKSLKILIEVINNRENVCILGDYDVDGSAATSLFVRFFESIKHPFFYYIPDREKDGYGASKKLFQKLILKKPKLIIMVDCGSTSNEAINFLNDKNIKSLIIDHHEIDTPFPKANMIINPKKNNGYVEYDYLCATTLVYFFLDLLSQKINSKFKVSDFLIYVLLATVCDVMPLRKLNRLIALNALKNFNISKNLALNELFHLNDKNNKLNINDLGYLIGPILNAGGRLGKPNYALDLLSSNDLKVVNIRSKELIKLNNKRKEIEKLIINEIDFKAIEKKNDDVIFYYNPSINEGLIGIIAARLKDYFNKPAIVITNSANVLKGSARSIYNYNIGRAIKRSLDKKIIVTGGGHNMAAGLTLEKKNLSNFQNFILNDFSKKLLSKNNVFFYDAEISSQALNEDFYSDIKKIEPFGTANPNPIFLFKDFKVIKINILKNNCLSVILKSKIGFSIKSIFFDSTNNKVTKYLLNYKKTFNVLGQISENIWNNKKALQLTIHDLII
jgi:single-stranded-DNA-specific exonuclease